MVIELTVAQSKYQQIKQFILQNIESGEWPEHAPVPSENALAQQFSVSRMTARRALQELSEQGVLTRTQGAATCVASIKSQSSLIEIRNIADEIHERGHQHQAKMLDVSSLNAEKSVAIQLGISEGEQVFRSVILHFENALPVQLEERYVSPKVVPEYLSQDFSVITPHTYLSKVAPLTEADHLIEATTASTLEADYLQIEPNQPVLKIQRRTWSSSAVVSFAILLHPGNRYRLGGHLTF